MEAGSFNNVDGLLCAVLLGKIKFIDFKTIGPDRNGESNINAKIADVRLAWYDDTDDDYYNGIDIDVNWKKGKEGFIRL